MLMDEAARAADAPLFLLAASRFRRHVEVAWDPVFGGFFVGMRADAGRVVTDKVLWVQEEVLVGLLLLLARLELLPAPRRAALGAWAARCYRRAHAYCFARFPLAQYGGRPLWAIALARDGTWAAADGAAVAQSSPQRVAARKENYHHPRALMLGIELLGELQSSERCKKA